MRKPPTPKTPRTKPLRRWRDQLVRGVRRLGASAYLVLALLFSVFIIADIGIQPLINSAETRLFDMLVKNRVRVPPADPDIVILDIDEASLAAMSPQFGRWPWPNEVLGQMVQALEAQGARAIVFDILFADRDTLRPASDAAFNAAIADSKTTFFPMLRLDPQNDALSRIPVGALPGALAEHANADGQATIAMILPKVPAALDNGRLGTHQVTPDKDGVIRRYPGWISHQGWRLHSLPQRVAQEFQFAGAREQEVLINWRGPPFTYRYVPFVDAYRALVRKEKPSGENWSGKIVVIGSTAPSLFDIKASPLARIHPGVEILATAIDNFKHGDMLHERPRWLMIVAALLLIWSMALALFRQTRIEIFDTVFVGLQVGLVIMAFAVLNGSAWYLDTSAPLTLGLLYFTVARLYHDVSHKLLANSLVRDLSAHARGQQLLGVMVVRLRDSKSSERRRLKGQLDQLVAHSALGAGRVANLVEDPGFIQVAFANTMLVFWLCPEADAPWQAESDHMEAVIRAKWSHPQHAGRLSFTRGSGPLYWQEAQAWIPAVYGIILKTLAATLAPAEPER